MFKLNTDGLRDSDSSFIAAGGVLKDNLSCWKKGFSKFLGTSNIILVINDALLPASSPIAQRHRQWQCCGCGVANFVLLSHHTRYLHNVPLPWHALFDLSQHKESEEAERNLRPVSSVAENPNIVSVEKNDSCNILTTKEEDFHLNNVTSGSPNSRDIGVSAEDNKLQGLDVNIQNNGSPLQSKTCGGYSEASCDSKACGVKNMDSGTAKASSDIGKDVGVAIDFLQRDCILEDANVGTQNSMNQTKQLEMQSGDEMKQMTSRFTSPDIRTRSLSPSAEMKDGNKRPAIICNFFAQGWCIRGSSCRFLHIKDHVNNSDQLAEGDLVTKNLKREVQLEEGLRDNAVAIQDEQASPGRHLSKDKQKLPLHLKEDLSSKNHALPIGRDGSTLRDNLFPQDRSMLNASRNNFNMNLSSYPPCTEGLATVQRQHIYNKYTSPVMSHSPNSTLVSHPATSMSLSHQIAAPSGYSFSFNSSVGASTLDAQKLLNNGKEYNPSGVSLLATRYKTKISSYDWEPSIPFRPSFFITPTCMSSPGDLYDPFHPSVEIPNIGDGSLKASFFIHGPPIQASSQRTYGENSVAGDKVTDHNEDKSSVSSHNRFYENESNRSCAPCEKDCLAPETETTARTFRSSHNGKSGVGENTLAIEDITKTENERTEHSGRHQGEGLEHNKKRVDRVKKNNEMHADFQMDSEVQNDLKALRNFRAALVDLVKDLLKPSWHEGRLSKDAHNTIVKKSVDKVISTLQPHQLPTTINMVNHYVSSSRSKIAKLVDSRLIGNASNFLSGCLLHVLSLLFIAASILKSAGVNFTGLAAEFEFDLVLENSNSGSVLFSWLGGGDFGFCFAQVTDSTRMISECIELIDE
ncbi:protein FRIGIDA-ESSENTIAL 1 [Senna tora]|uniref:Protein FRIGIDA-ESSENTIAL 1 n=1 Tax=Senna tora TaxID=362788 RepID=A0A834SFJ3_9FABA|nr:protein FRIGIDA-ESSENTIAL 1 [Senna tora]